MTSGLTSPLSRCIMKMLRGVDRRRNRTKEEAIDIPVARGLKWGVITDVGYSGHRGSAQMTRQGERTKPLRTCPPKA